MKRLNLEASKPQNDVISENIEENYQDGIRWNGEYALDQKSPEQRIELMFARSFGTDVKWEIKEAE